jgi:hypothetical protein
MCMAQSIHAQTGYEIEITFSIQIVKKNAFAALEDQGVAVVGLKQKLPFALDDFVRVWHREKRKTIVPKRDTPTERGLAKCQEIREWIGEWACKVLLRVGLPNARESFQKS